MLTGHIGGEFSGCFPLNVHLTRWVQFFTGSTDRVPPLLPLKKRREGGGFFSGVRDFLGVGLSASAEAGLSGSFFLGGGSFPGVFRFSRKMGTRDLDAHFGGSYGKSLSGAVFHPSVAH